ncbi:MAG: 50S ribosomal protein L25 [Bacteroidales bacterium]|nr:50S ribosomal protein L25 [Bacteroidales bacterium]MBO7142710.1 50S ribosomal protein L25 [Bacteroidales bacterium]
MKVFEIKGTKRENIGTKFAKDIRKEGLVPCVAYCADKHIDFTVSKKEINGAIFTPEVFIIKIEIDGTVYNTVIKDMQFHPVTDEVMHIDFYIFNDEQEITVKLPVVFEGHAPGVKAGGKLKTAARKLKVTGKAANLPERIIVSIAELELEQQIKVHDLHFDNYRISDPQDMLLCRIVATRATQQAAAADDGKKKKK